MVIELFVNALFGTLEILGPIWAPVTEPPKETDVPAMVIALLANIAFVTELVGKDSVPPVERVNVPEKVGLALGAYVEEALAVVR